MAVRTDYVLVTVRTPHGGRCGDPQQKRGSARTGIPNYVLGIILCVPRDNGAATHEYCDRWPESQVPALEGRQP